MRKKSCRETGTGSWSPQDTNQNIVLAARPDIVISAGNERGVTGFSPYGDELWQVETDGRIETVAVVDDRVCLNDGTGSVAVLTIRGDEMWRRANAHDLSVDSDPAYAVGDGLHVLSIEDGEQRWKLETSATVAIPANDGLFILNSTSPQDVRLSLHS